MEQYNFDGDYSLSSVVIQNSTHELDIREMVSELSIYESVNSVSISCDILVSDSKNILESFPIQGYESIIINVSTKGVVYKIPLILYKISNRVLQEKSQVYIINCISPEAVLNESSRFSKRFKKQYPHDIVKDLLKNKLKTPKKVDIDLSLFHIDFVNPNWRIFDTLAWLSRRTVPNANQNSCGYLFYETLDGFNYKSIDNLLYQSPVNPTTPFIYNPANTSSTPNKFRIVQLISPDYFDHLETLRFGGLSHYTVKLDFNNRSKITSKSTINDYWKYSTHLGNSPTFDTTIKHTPTRILVKPSLNNLFSDNGNVPEPDHINKLIDRAIYRYQSLDSICLNVQVVGNLDLRVGKIYNVIIPSTNPTNATRERQLDTRMSGNYMMHSLKTTINRTNSFTICKLVKDSFDTKSMVSTNNFIDVPVTNIG